MHATFSWLRGGPARHCMGRYGRPFGFGAALGHGDHALHGFRSGRKLGADDLQLVILALLEEKPRHGYEIIKALEERSGGFYSPSPGTIYPALTYLEELGYARVEVEGAKKSYHITDAGRDKLDERRAFAEAMFDYANLDRPIVALWGLEPGDLFVIVGVVAVLLVVTNIWIAIAGGVAACLGLKALKAGTPRGYVFYLFYRSGLVRMLPEGLRPPYLVAPPTLGCRTIRFSAAPGPEDDLSPEARFFQGGKQFGRVP